MLKVRDYEEAFTAAEDAIFGLSAGMVMGNLPTAGFDYYVAFGVNKASSQGQREQGSHARRFFTQVKPLSKP